MNSSFIKLIRDEGQKDMLQPQPHNHTATHPFNYSDAMETKGDEGQLIHRENYAERERDKKLAWKREKLSRVLSGR